MNQLAPVAPSARRSRFRGRHLVALIAVFSFSQAFAQGEPQTIAAPHYGDVLYQHYQDETYAALGSLMVSQHFRRLGPHGEESELLRGGLLLAYGLHEEAGRVFTALIARNAAPAVLDRAWYFLAVARQQRGLLAQAEEALSRIAAPLPGDLQTERLLLQAQLRMALGDYAAAAALLQGVQGDSTPARYARYNLAVALVQAAPDAAARQRGLLLLGMLGQQQADSDEQRSLRDRANLALGYAQLQDQQPREARNALQRVRLHGVQANKALLGYGWAAMGLNDPQQAVVPWAELAARPEGDAAVLEARLAVPYALGEMGAYASALRGYEQAAAGYAQEQRSLAETLAAVSAGKLITELLAQNPGEGLGRFDGIKSLPAAPHTAQLLPLLASHAFHEGFKNLRDLQFLGGEVQQGLDTLGSFENMLDNRRQAYAERLPRVLAQRGAAAIAALQQQRDSLAAQMREAQAAADGRAYASPAEQQLQEHITRGHATLARLQHAAAEMPAADLPSVDIATLQERLRRAEAALSWQLADAQTARAWQAQTALRVADSTLAQARAHEATLVQAQQTEPARQAAFADRITALRARLQAVLPQLQALGAEQQAALQAQAVAALEQQQAQLVVYAAQAQLAIAQIQDSAQFARENTKPAGALR